jgi:sugar/nucleoside kinase (ribokinase family)
MSLLVVGTVAFDSVESPFGKAEHILGGAGTYIGLSASYLTQPIHLVSVVGEDFPEEHFQRMRNRNIDISGIEVVKGGKTFFWAGKYRQDLNTRDTLDTQLNVLANFNPIVPDHMRSADFLMLGNLLPDVQRKVMEQLNGRPKLVVMDTMNFWIEHYHESLMEGLKLTDVLTINDEEARMLSGEYALPKAAQKILSMGPKYLVIKKGEHGALLFGEGKAFFAPALPLEEVFDPTGAGDSFAGGFIGYLSRTQDVSFENMKRALIYGSVMASFCVEKFGTEQLVHLNTSDINDRIRRFVELTQFEIPLS